MTVMNYKLLNFVRFSSVHNWSVYFTNESEKKYSDKYSLKKIGDFLFRDKTSIEIQDDIIYRRVSVKWYGEGIKERDCIFGKEIKTKSQFLLKKNQFLLSKIDARNGAFGVVPKECDGAIITGNFWTFDVDYEQINPHFLKLFTSTKHFQDLCQRASNGTTNRNYLQEGLFLNMEIPLPDKVIQDIFVNQYNQKLTQAQEAEKQSNELEKNIENYLLSELGIEKTNAVEKKEGLQLIKYRSLSRWDYLFLTNDFELKQKYSQQRLSYFIDKFLLHENNFSLRFESYKQPKEEYYYLGMENIEKGTGRIVEMSKVKGDAIKSQTIRVPKNYFIYGKLRPYLNKYWYNDTDNDSIICSSEFFVFSIKDNFNRLYFQYILSSLIIQKQIENITSGVRMPRINESFFKNLQIPLPPLDIQEKIVSHITAEKEKIKSLRQQAEELRKQAKEEFENEIFAQ